MIIVENFSGKYRHACFELIRAYLPDKEFSNDSVILRYDNRNSYLCLIYEEKIYNVFVKQGDEFFEIRKSLFEILKQLTKCSKKWGLLTGIRPTKLAYNLYKKNGHDCALKNLVEDRLMSTEGANEILDIVERQDELIERHKNGYSVYVHIPFCRSKCSYCSFHTYVNAYDLHEPYTKALVNEISGFKKKLREPSAIYVGGGTPTSIGLYNLSLILSAISAKFGKAQEFTVECGRPEDLTDEMLKLLKSFGVTRISINPQTFKSESLRSLSRNHTVDDIYAAYNRARRVSFDSINMDFILGLPGEGKDTIINSLKIANQLKPDNITLHALAIKNGSKMIRQDLEYKFDLDRLYSEIDELLGLDYKKYYLYRQKRIYQNGENIGYALDKKMCLYNIMMIEEAQEIYAFGMGASSRLKRNDGFETRTNYRDIDYYIKKVRK